MTKIQYKNILLKLSITLSLLVPVWFALAAKGSTWGWWSWQTGLMKLSMGWGIKLMMLAAVLAVITLLVSIFIKPRNGIILAIIALLIPVSGMVYGKQIRTKAAGLPFIHDVSTDTINPPEFSDVILTARGSESNPAHYIGKKVPRGERLVADAQREGYPNLTTVNMNSNISDVYARALAAVETMGWEIHTQDQAAGIIEATDTTFWYGFKDDVVVRLTAVDDATTAMDVRSLSRVGGSDIGKNADRINQLIQAINK